MSTYFKNREADNSYYYYEKASVFSYGNIGYDSKETKAKSVGRNMSNKDTWRLSEPSLSETEREFMLLSDKWKRETCHYSTMFHKLNNPNYLKIIGMGEDALKFILKDLKKSLELWHEALYFITKENPVEPKDMDDIIKIREAWLAWGKKRNYIS